MWFFGSWVSTVLSVKSQLFLFESLFESLSNEEASAQSFVLLVIPFLPRAFK